MPRDGHDADADDLEVIVFGNLGDQRAHLGRADVDADDDAVVAHRASTSHRTGRSPKRTSINLRPACCVRVSSSRIERSDATCWSTLPSPSNRARQPSRVGTSRPGVATPLEGRAARTPTAGQQLGQARRRGQRARVDPVARRQRLAVQLGHSGQRRQSRIARLPRAGAGLLGVGVYGLQNNSLAVDQIALSPLIQNAAGWRSTIVTSTVSGNVDGDLDALDQRQRAQARGDVPSIDPEDVGADDGRRAFRPRLGSAARCPGPEPSEPGSDRTRRNRTQPSPPPRAAPAPAADRTPSAEKPAAATARAAARRGPPAAPP